MSDFDLLDENLGNLTPEQIDAIACYKEAVSCLMEDTWANLMTKKAALVGLLEKHGPFKEISELPESTQEAYFSLQDDALDLGVKYQKVVRSLSPTAFA